MRRRVSRLRTEPPNRKPVLVVGALLIGAVVGLITVPRLSSAADARVENYVILASTLYSQGENPALLRDRLVSVGISQPASVVLTMAQRYAGSRDKKQQHQSEMLDAFGKVLLDPEAAATPTPRPTEPAAVPTPTMPAQPQPTTTGQAAGTPAAPAGTPAAAGRAQPAGTPTAGASAPAAPTVPAGVVQKGKIKPPDGGSARLRQEPSQDGGTLSLIPNAATVDILETVRGQMIDGENKWYRVRYGSLTGYLWSKLVVVGQ